MVVVITSNIESESFELYKNNNDDFIIAMVVHDRSDVMKDTVQYYSNDRVDVYYKEGMDITQLKEDYEDDSDDTEYHYHPMIYYGEVINDINEKLEAIEKYDPLIFLACEDVTNRKIKKVMNDYFTKESVELNPINLLTYYKVASVKAMGEVVKKTLNTQFIYHDDPIQFGMAVALMLKNQR